MFFASLATNPGTIALDVIFLAVVVAFAVLSGIFFAKNDEGKRSYYLAGFCALMAVGFVLLGAYHANKEGNQQQESRAIAQVFHARFGQTADKVHAVANTVETSVDNESCHVAVELRYTRTTEAWVTFWLSVGGVQKPIDNWDQLLQLVC